MKKREINKLFTYTSQINKPKSREFLACSFPTPKIHPQIPIHLLLSFTGLVKSLYNALNDASLVEELRE